MARPVSLSLSEFWSNPFDQRLRSRGPAGPLRRLGAVAAAACAAPFFQDCEAVDAR